MSKRIAVFPGSFDPITIGHYSLVERAIELFDEIIVGIGTNTNKSYLFSEEERFKMVEDAFKEVPEVSVKQFNGLTVDFCRDQNSRYILRGLRNSGDFEFEKNISQINQALAPEIETVILVTNQDLSAISSSIVRELIKNDADVAQFLPPNVSL